MAAAAMILFAALVAVPTVGKAQRAGSAQQVTPEQLRMLQQLPPSQRQELMRSLGITPGATRSTDSEDRPEDIQAMPPMLPDEEEEEEEPRLGPSSDIVLTLTLDEDLDGPELLSVSESFEEDRWLADLEGSNTFQLDDDGVLHLPGVASIPLAGLTVEEAARRISAEDSLEIFDALVTYLPLDPEGREALEPFGYLTFKGRVAASFQPPTDMPVPQDYVVGPGDIVSVQLFGNVNAQNELPVNRDGNINFPEIGPIAVAGLEFSEMRDVIEQRVGEQMIGVRTSITMGELRSIRVFVLGDVNRPGSYSVSSLSTVTNAMYLAGGVAPGGTLRDVQIKRNGKLVRRIDGYEFMLRGDTSDDIRLQPGDVIFVPPVGVQVGVEGEVRRPAIYEINGEKTVADVIDLAGGTLPTAYRGKVRLERVGPDADRRVVSVDLRDPKGRSTPIVDGDVIYVDPVIDRLAGSVRLTGHLYRPGAYQWTSGMRLSDLIPSLSYLKPKADRNYLLIRREIEASGPVSAVSADLEAALRSPHSDADSVLLERDEIFVFDLETGRKRQIGPILEDLALQASFGEPGREVAVSGHVRAPGRYPLEDGMRVSDLIRAGAGLQEAAYGLDAELTRYVVGPDRRRQSELVKVSLAEILAGDSTADVLLQPYDILQVKETPLWREQWSVEIRGEVNFPGKFAITSGETLLNVLERAGGLTEFAFPEGSVFIREDLKEREREQLNRLADRIESDLATIGLQAARFEDANVSQTMGLGQSLLSQMRDAEPVGRLVIDLPYLLEHSDAEHDLVLKDGDTLIIPGQTQTVTVLGEVQYSTSHLFRAGLDRDDYLSLSGGLTVNADKKRIYVVKANGAVVVGSSGSKWFRRSAATGIEAGDTIVVPLDVDRMPSLALWRTSTTILYNLAISVAAIGSL
jgi:protein involved in polysaccharide export with SLBB domain